MSITRTARKSALSARRAALATKSHIRDSKSQPRSRRGRHLVVGTAIAASAALALPASATAEEVPFVDHVFQVPSLVLGSCSHGVLGVDVNVVPAKASTVKPGPYGVGNVTFRFQYVPIRRGALLQLTGTVTVAWLNLSTFRSGVASAPIMNGISDFPYYGQPGMSTGAAIDVNTGRGEIVAIVLPNGSVNPTAGLPAPAPTCTFTPSVGSFTSP